MGDIQLHHLFNHLAPIGVMVGFIVLIVGFILKKEHIRLTAAWIILIAGVTVLPASKTGELAEEISENISGVSHDVIHEHEEAAELALKLTLFASVIALGFIIVHKKAPKWSTMTSVALLIVGLISVITLTLASHEGGLIRHPELSGQSGTNATDQEQNDRHEDDH
ncbi:MAG: hypothetical protein IPP69_02095 [Flavobacteriales bacterium]|nr:hypothetical protein [Flavobacteriales bacterium]